MRYVVLTTLDLLHVLGIPIYIPLYGRPGEWAFATSQENPSVADFEGGLGSEFWRLLPRPARGGWDNRMLARGLASLDEAVPMDELTKVRCPVLFVGARRDDMVPYAYLEEARRRVTTSELVSYDCGHFDLYVGQPHAENARRQADFLARALLLSSLPEGDAPMADELFRDRNLNRARFDDVALSEASFRNVNLRRATFDDVALAGATLTNVDLSHVAIRDACIEGLTIDGFDVKDLIAAERDRRERERGG